MVSSIAYYIVDMLLRPVSCWQMQRTTNTMASSSFRPSARGQAKSSKALYVSSAQTEIIRRSTAAGLGV